VRVRSGAVTVVVVCLSFVLVGSAIGCSSPAGEPTPMTPAQPFPAPSSSPPSPLLDPAPPRSSDSSLASRSSDDRPNILLITTDDMNVTDLRWMPRTRRLLQERGVRVDGFLSNHPLCCPARAEILTGQYGHNSGVIDNERSRFGGYQAMKRKGQHIGAWLRSQGYATAFVGKHLNGWEFTQRQQPGWTVFNPISRGVYSPFDVTMFRDGRPRLYPDIHTSDVVGDATVRYIKRFARSSRPFFIWASQLAPHGMFVDGRWTLPVPAARHRDAYPDALPPSLANPSFAVKALDKPAWVQQAPLVLASDQIAWHRARIRSLQSVDDQVAAAVNALRETKQLDNTYVFFTSDNGYLMGEHGLTEKNVPYETALRVPLLVRGPDIPNGESRDQLFGMVDLAPTFLDIANVVPPVVVDGRSMLASLTSAAPGYTSYLIQASGWKQAPGVRWWWRGVLTRRYVYVEYRNGFTELYDLRGDPHQLDNVSADDGYARAQQRLSSRLDGLVDCVGDGCSS
jgi:N-acetylglucosamine-6-sulfatase